MNSLSNLLKFTDWPESSLFADTLDICLRDTAQFSL